MTRAEILAALKQELDSFTDEDLEALAKSGHHSPHIWFKFGKSSMASANVALHNVNAARSHAQFERLQKTRGAG